MAKKEKKNPLEEAMDVSKNEVLENEPVFESDIDFWQEVLTEYGEIESPMHLKLLLKKLETEAARESAKIKKKQKMVAQRNKAAKKKDAERAKAEKRLMSSLPPAKRMEAQQKLADAKLAAKQKAEQAKIDAAQTKKQAKADLQAKKVVDAEFKMQERLFMLSLTPQEKADYRFLKNAKQRIEAAKNKIDSAKGRQSEVASSNIMPVKGFLIALAICVAVTAIITFCGTNIYLDSGYYNEKVDVLKSGLEDFDLRLEGGPVENASDLEGGLSVYQQILEDMPVVEEQLQKLNKTYFWVLDKETPDSLGLNAISEKASALQDSVDQLQAIVDANTAFTETVDTTYHSSTSLDSLVTELNDLSIQIDQLINSFDQFDLPAGLPAHKAAFREKLTANQTYIQLVIAYVNELVTTRGGLDGAEAIINDAAKMNTRSSDSLEDKIADYLNEMKEVVAVHKQLTVLNNNIAYAQVIGKKDFSFLAGGALPEGSLKFYMDMVELEDIVKESNKVEQKCLDFEKSSFYPKLAKETNETILTHRSQGTTDAALATNQELETRIAAISVPDEITASVRVYARGLATRTEFLKLQQQYIALSKEKDQQFSEYDKAKTAYDTAKYSASAEKHENGRTDAYYTLVDEMDEAEKQMDAAEKAAEAAADVIQEQMKDIRGDSKKGLIKLRNDYQDDLDY